jgi:hypothetical protein
MCDALDELLTVSERLWRNNKTIREDNLPPEASVSYNAVLGTGNPLGTKGLKKLTDESQNILSEVHKRVNAKRPSASKCTLVLDIKGSPPFIMPPLDDDQAFVPILELTYAINEKTMTFELHFRVAMVGWFDLPTNETCGFVGMGFRFETEEQGSNHNYYHMQPTPEPHKGGQFRGLLCNPFMPGTYPCTPLPAVNAVSLVFAFIAGFYGRKGVEALEDKLKLGEAIRRPVTCMMSQQDLPPCL